jgi:prenyltransferase beta subunit
MVKSILEHLIAPLPLLTWLDLKLMTLERGRDSVMSCLSHEGGFDAMSGSEAHADYTYCAISTLETESDQFHAQSDGNLEIKLANFAKSLQEFDAFESRTNKLMDCCYSFWIGAVLQAITGLSAIFWWFTCLPRIIFLLINKMKWAFYIIVMLRMSMDEKATKKSIAEFSLVHITFEIMIANTTSGRVY